MNNKQKTQRPRSENESNLFQGLEETKQTVTLYNYAVIPHTPLILQG
jgi:hypothetical protein